MNEKDANIVSNCSVASRTEGGEEDVSKIIVDGGIAGRRSSAKSKGTYGVVDDCAFGRGEVRNSRFPPRLMVALPAPLVSRNNTEDNAGAP